MSENGIKTLLLVLGAALIAQALWMFFGPQSFYDAVGPFGVYNDHYVRDAATFTFGLGAILVLAAPRPSWRVPALAVTAITFAAHAINHLVDIGDADPKVVGYIDFFLLAGTAVMLAGLARKVDQERQSA
ncbi:MAG: DUF4345 family protein [Thermoleophilaceae bacterium]|nr:DUF4345 family protein [Thermoleophilaceae bacterium]